MKNKFLGLLLLELMNSMAADNTIQQAQVIPINHIEQYYKHPYSLNENDYRKKLYEWEKDNSDIFMLDDFPIDYYVGILKDHVNDLEDKMAKKRYGFRSNAMFDGALFLALSSLWGHVTYTSYKKMIQDETVASYVKTLVENIEGTYKPEAGLTLASYIKTLEEVCNKRPEITMGGIAMLSATAALLAVLAGIKFYEVATYAQRLKKELEKGKRVLAVLEEIKAARIA